MAREAADGVPIVKIRDGAPAAFAGLMPGDVVVEFAGRSIQNRQDLVQAVASTPPGGFVPISFERREERFLTVMRLP
ncbi:PDZ domain-containing protein [Tardiphaga sp.]|uniref:PDZ domain-containing protein n=1 Tax=Tardiphaga sp. TaxID=1926292 RepID=UPI00352B05D0